MGAVINGVFGETMVVFDAGEQILLCRRHNFLVHDQRNGAVVVVRGMPSIRLPASIVALPHPLHHAGGDDLNGFAGVRYLSGCWRRRPIPQ